MSSFVTHHQKHQTDYLTTLALLGLLLLIFNVTLYLVSQLVIRNSILLLLLLVLELTGVVGRTGTMGRARTGVL